MRIASDQGNYVSVERVAEAPSPDLSVLVSVAVRWRDFAGRVQVWILREEWANFCQQLTRLEQERRGSATVESISPRELRLTIRSTDLAGHMAVDGEVGYRGVFGETLLSFAPIDFDPTLLPQLAREADEMLEGAG
jgi:hypothetical protein